MSTAVKVVIIVVVLALIGGGAYLVFGRNAKTSTNTTINTSNSQSSNQDNNASTDKTEASVITYTDSGFSPNVVTVKSGDTLTITNNSSDAIQFDSNPHPAHTDNTEINVGIVNSGQSKSFTVIKTGSWLYHNHLEPENGGTINVQ